MQSFFGNVEGSLVTDDPVSCLRPDLSIQQVKLSSQFCRQHSLASRIMKDWPGFEEEGAHQSRTGKLNVLLGPEAHREMLWRAEEKSTMSVRDLLWSWHHAWIWEAGKMVTGDSQWYFFNNFRKPSGFSILGASATPFTWLCCQAITLQSSRLLKTCVR